MAEIQLQTEMHDELIINSWVFDDTFDWGNLSDKIISANELINQNPDKRAYSIFLVNKIHRYPPDVISHLPTMSASTPPQVQIVIVVGKDSFVATLVDVFTRVFMQKIKLVSTVEEARVVIAEHELKLSEI